MNNLRYTHIFFDLDRTLWDFTKNSAEALADIIVKYSLDNFVHDVDEFIDKYNYYNDRLWDFYRSGRIKKAELRKERFRLLLQEYNISDEVLTRDISNFYLNTAPSKTLLIEHTTEILRYLSESYSLYILSNGFYDVQLSKMVNSGISSYFKKLFTSDRIGYSKPDSRIFDYAVKSVNAKKEASLMVGDDEIIDIEGARKARMDQMFFNPEGKTPAVQPTYEIRSLLEIKKWL